MTSLRSTLILVLLVVNVARCQYAEPLIMRDIPNADSLPTVFTETQSVTVPIPAGLRPAPIRWRALDDRNATVRADVLDSSSETVLVGPLDIGWYRIEFIASDDSCAGWTTTAVLAKPVAPTPQDSPICVDSATAWFARNDPAGQEALTRLAALAGVNWVRDRMRWRDVQPESGRFEANTTYDSSAEIQFRHGLKVLQVFHSTPAWAVEESGATGRYPTDLRHAYRFCRAMAERFKGRVQAWEPWNEGNVATFGGHTADEMCSYQKAAYLGFKAGDPDVIVCWNVSTATPTKLHTRVVLANETWSYFDTYNTHTYDWPDSYERLWKPVHEAACGRPIWVTESDRGLAYSSPEPWCDFSPEADIQKAEFMAQSYASSFFAGADRHFHFILGHYCEGGKIQFGLLRLDRTPRPSYVALAAIGRFLAGARCLGKWNLANQPNAHVYAFSARPDGQVRDVLVAWAEKPADWDQRGKTTVEWALPGRVRVDAVYDYLGRSLGRKVPSQLRSAPIFVLLAPDNAALGPLVPRRTSEYRPASVCPIVLQLALPKSHSVNIRQIPWASDFEHQVQPETELDLPLYAYNFGDTTVSGTIHIEHAPAEWKLAPYTWDITLEPMGRAKLPCRFIMSKRQIDKNVDTWIKLKGDFGAAGAPVLAFRLICEPGEGYDAEVPQSVNGDR